MEVSRSSGQLVNSRWIDLWRMDSRMDR